MPKCIELLPCYWLISNLCYQAIEQVYLIKWPVSAYVYICMYIYTCMYSQNSFWSHIYGSLFPPQNKIIKIIIYTYIYMYILLFLLFYSVVEISFHRYDFRRNWIKKKNIFWVPGKKSVIQVGTTWWWINDFHIWVKCSFKGDILLAISADVPK